MFPFYPQKYISHLCIALSLAVTGISFIIPGFSSQFAFVGIGWQIFPLFTVIPQIALFQFLHGGIFHLLLNSYFLYVIGPEVEARMSRERFIIFFLISTLFVVLGLTFFAPTHPTVGISGFCMALMAYLALDLRDVRHPLANQVLIMLAVNIGIGFMPGISFFGHLFGAIAGGFFWYLKGFWK